MFQYHESTISMYRLSFPLLKIFKYKRTKPVRMLKNAFAIIDFGKFRYKSLQVRIT